LAQEMLRDGLQTLFQIYMRGELMTSNQATLIALMLNALGALVFHNVPSHQAARDINLLDVLLLFIQWPLSQHLTYCLTVSSHLHLSLLIGKWPLGDLPFV
jgi:hypothetical protein